jgi:hypothetical protein
LDNKEAYLYSSRTIALFLQWTPTVFEGLKNVTVVYMNFNDHVAGTRNRVNEIGTKVGLYNQDSNWRLGVNN